MNHPSHRSPRLASLLCCLMMLLPMTIGRVDAQPYTIPDPCSHYTITYAAVASPSISGTIPVDVELKHVPDVVSHPSIGRHYDLSTSVSSSQQYGFTGNLYYVGSITVFGTAIPQDGQPHRVPTGTPGVCAEVNITSDPDGCPVIAITLVRCCDTYTVSWDNFATGAIVIERADHTTITRNLPNNSNPDIDNTTESDPNDPDNPVIGIIVGETHLTPGSTYRTRGHTVGGTSHCVEYSVGADPITGCITINVRNIPCPPHCDYYYIIISDNCQASAYFPIDVEVGGYGHTGGLDDQRSFTESGIYTYPVPYNVSWVSTVKVIDVDIPIDGLPHILNIPGTFDHYRLKVTATFDWETGCTTITIECLYVIG